MPSPSHRINHQHALLLAATPWRESSLLLELFSRDYGRVVLVARSARKRQSELRGVLVPFVPLSASWYGQQELKILHRAEWLGGWPQPQGRALFSALYVNELVLRLTAREDPHPQLYAALAAVLRHIAIQPDNHTELRRFEWALLRELGLAPDITQDIDGHAIEADQRYWLRPEHPPLPLAQAQAQAQALQQADGMAVHGHTLHALSGQPWPHTAAAAEALRLNRLLLDFRLPEGIHARRVLQQLQQITATIA